MNRYYVDEQLAIDYISANQITIEDITSEQLYYLAIQVNIIDSMIAQLLNATQNQVIYRRKKYGIRVV